MCWAGAGGLAWRGPLIFHMMGRGKARSINNKIAVLWPNPIRPDASDDQLACPGSARRDSWNSRTCRPGLVHDIAHVTHEARALHGPARHSRKPVNVLSHTEQFMYMHLRANIPGVVCAFVWFPC